MLSKGAQIIVLQIENIARISTAAVILLLCCCSSLDAVVIETLPGFDSVANASGAVNIIFDNYVPDIPDNDGNLIKVFLIGGQSNAAGSGLNSEYPAPYQMPQYDVEFWNGGRLPGDDVPDYTSWDRAGDTEFRPLELGSGNYLGGTHSGPEMSLGRTLKDTLPDHNIAIVKYGMSGSALKRGLRPDGAGDWDSDPAPLGSSFDGVRYHVFKNSAVLPALQAITDRDDCYEIAGMFWMQGETDAGNLTAANEYEANLNKLINSVRTEFSAPQMRFVIGRIRTVMGAYNATVRTAMENVAAADPLVEWVNTDDLNMNGDNVHYSAIGQVGLGERFAHAYLSTVPSRMRGDLQLDDDVDLGDFAIFAHRWMDICSGSCGEGYLDWADINEDCRVGLYDLRILADFWLTDLLMHCSFDETGGLAAHDSSAFSQTWLLHNFPDDDSQWVAGKIDGALVFDGSDDYVDLRSSFNVLDGATEFTIAFWVNPAQLPFTTHDGIIGIGSADRRTPWIFGLQGTDSLFIQFETVSGGAGDCGLQTAGVFLDTWTHIALTWDGSTCTSYINGVFDNSDTTTGNTLAFSSGSSYLGHIDGYGYWNGLMDDIRIYNRELGLEEIQVLANQ
jgi:hypothetical protein